MIAWFSNFDYTLIYCLDGDKAGVAIAFPAQEFYVNNCFFKDPMQTAAAHKTTTTTTISKIVSLMWSAFGSTTQTKDATNEMILIELERKSDRTRFIVATCQLQPQNTNDETVLQSAYVRHCMQQILERTGCTLGVLAGDFGATPNDDVYRALTDVGKILLDDRQLDARLEKLQMSFNVSMQSAHALRNGVEPKCTRKWHTIAQGLVCDTVDYIFLYDTSARNQRVLKAECFANCDDDDAGLPSYVANEPSAHLMLSATISVD